MIDEIYFAFVIRLSEKQQQQKKNKKQQKLVRTAEDYLVWTVSHRYSGPSYAKASGVLG